MLNLGLQISSRATVALQWPAAFVVRSYHSDTGVKQQLGTSVGDKKNEAVIKIPHRMQRRIETVQQLKHKKVGKVTTTRAGKQLIVSKNSKFNQPASYTVGKFDQPVLASKGWKHNKSFGDYFIINNTQSTPPFVNAEKNKTDKETESIKRTFQSLGLCPELTSALQSVGIVHPTIVQLQTIPNLLRGKNVLCAAETGSGKTLCYLLPIIHKLQADRVQGWEPKGIAAQSIVLVPSRELADQIKAVARPLCAPFGLTVKAVGGGRGLGKIKLAFSSGTPELIVATPGALWKAMQRKCVDLSSLGYCVLDEADSLFDESFVNLVEKILSQTRVASSPTETKGIDRKSQLVVIGATFPGGVGEVLSQVTDLGSIVTVKSKNLHFLMPHVQQTFMKVRGADKLLELLHVIQMSAASGDNGGVLVFCNSSSTVNWLGYLLDDNKIKHLRLQGQMPAAMRAGIFRSFQKGLVNVLVCTDLASRGLDTKRVRTVVNYDFPLSHTDYIHRAGRVGRMGSSETGSVISFVTHPWEVELVQKIETAARKRTSLPGMESGIRKPVEEKDLIEFESNVKEE
ncbi:probable ATP-dependent RNA helicase DDX28 [Erpetoichthys calabaricus]|uniref:RNA helicase n=1 Tax=Erpetoichthys calabaricus TaxID=27687 RepID=A0A8C4XDG4_ERPCA|nr:probable ATP-dependent RNA helicase DDX28 [Erpetoichthys calabaricus]